MCERLELRFDPSTSNCQLEGSLNGFIPVVCGYGPTMLKCGWEGGIG